MLDGPRGRRLCLELAQSLSSEAGSLISQLGFEFDPDAGTSRISITARFGHGVSDAHSEPKPSIPALVSAIDCLHAEALAEGIVRAAFSAAVGAARYWQDPDGEDVLAAHPDVRAAFEPLALHVSTMSELGWWYASSRPDQWLIDWENPGYPAPAERPDLDTWAMGIRAEEERSQRDRPRDPSAAYSGPWWSAPVVSRRSTAGRIPEAFDLVEDDFGWDAATVTPSSAPEQVIEIRTAGDWVDLCRAHPIEVTASRRHDWYRTTGIDSRWVIPDWSAIAGQAEGVHLTAAAYLELAGRALPVDDGLATVIAGWDPDATFWLQDDPVTAGPGIRWVRDRDSESWTIN